MKTESFQYGSLPLWKISVIEGLAGSFGGFATDAAFYGVDSYKVMAQSGKPIVLSKLYRGIFPVALMGSTPSLGIFFAFYTPMKKITDDYLGAHSSASVLVSSLISAIPSSLIAVPADTVKKRLVLSHSHSLMHTVNDIISLYGYRGLFLGWQANMIKDVPFAIIKMSLYEIMASIYLKLVPSHHKKEELDSIDSAIVGFLSGAATGVLTNPLDCVNTRIKSGELDKFSIWGAHKEIVSRDGWKALFRGVIPRTFIMGFGSTVFWYCFGLVKEYGPEYI